MASGSEADVSGLLDRLPAMTVVVDADERIVRASDDWLTRLGCQREAVLGRPFADFLSSPRGILRLGQLLEDREIVRDQPFELVTSGDETLPVLLSVVAERHPDGRLAHAHVVLSEVREIRRLERKLADSRERFEQVVSVSREGFWDYDLKKGIIYLSPMWYELLGLVPQDGCQPRSVLEDRIHPDDVEDLCILIDAGLKDHAERPAAVVRMWHAEGRWIWVECKGKAVRDQHGTCHRMVGTMVDVTARKEGQARLQRYADELHRSNLELEQFAYVASHDLQEPLRMVLGYCELLQRRYAGRLDADADTFIEFAVDGARRMQGMIVDLLTYSRLGPLQRLPAVIEPQQVIVGALDNLHRAIDENEAKVVHGDLPPVLGDASQLTQLFQNLIGNAIKYRSAAPPEIRIETETCGEYVAFAVRDNGIGIEARYADRIFEIFKRLHPRDAYPGSGIGLAICKRIIDRHGGRIWLDRGMGRGSCFRFTLPAALPEEPHAAVDARRGRVRADATNA